MLSLHSRASPSLIVLAFLNRAPDSLIFNTLDCHRLLLLAWKTGREKLQHPLMNLLFEALYIREENLSKDEVLAHYAEKVGLMSKHEVCVVSFYYPFF